MNLSKEQLTVVLLAVGLTVATVALSPGMVFGPTEAPDDAKSGVTYTSEPADNTVDRGPPGSYDSADLMAVPDGYTQTATEQAREPPEVRASAGAQTMQVSVVEDDGEVALQLEDDRVHDGRWVSIPSQWFEAEVGGVPEVAYVAHESGDDYKTKLYTRGEDVAFYVEEFSTNTVTFSGEVSVTGNFSDGGSAQYELSNYDAASDPVVNLTGTVSTEWDNETTTLSDGETASVSVASPLEPTGPSANGEPVVAFTGSSTTAIHSVVDDEGDGVTDRGQYLVGDTSSNDYVYSGYEFTPSSSGELTATTMEIESVTASQYSPNVDVYVASGGVDQVWREGTLVKENWTPEWQTGNQTITFDTPVDVSQGSTYEIEFVTESSDNDGEHDRLDLNADDSAGSVKHTRKLIGSGNEFSDPHHGALYFDIVSQTESPSLDLDDDGTSDASYSGTLADGETVTREIPGLTDTTTAYSVAVGGGSNTVTVDLRFKERVGTSDPGIELNTESVSHSGTLAAGETVQYNLSQESLREGTNQLNVSVGDGTLSSDAPTPKVGVELTHDAVNQKSVEYGGGQWTETYNVSETYASSRQNASLTVPFQSNVYAIQNIEAQTNGSGWSSVEPSNYNLSDTTLTVDLSAFYGGEIPEGTTMDVRTTGTTVAPIAGTIQVTDPSTPDQPLNSTVELVDWGPDSALDITGTPLGDRVHYVSDATYDSPDAYSDFEGDGTHVLELRNASADNSLTVRTLPLRIEPKQGDAHVSVPDGRVNRSEPVYRVTPGDTVGDAYDVTFTNATSGEDYILWSETNEIVVDSGTASSPLTLSDDEDNVATMQFRLDDGTAGGSTDSGSGDSGGAPMPMPTTGGDTNFVPLIGVAIVGGLVIVASRNDGVVADTGANAAQRLEDTLGGIPIAGPALGKGLGGLIESSAGLLEAVVGNQTIALSIVTALLLGAVQGGILEVPQSSLTIIIVGGVAIYSAVALRDLGEFTTARWAAVLAATTVVAVQSLSSESLLTAIVNSDVWPVLALSLVYLAWQGVQGLDTPDQVTNVQLETEQSDGGDNQ